MADIYTNLTTLVNACEDIKAAIRYVGGTIADEDGFEDFGPAIDFIPTEDSGVVSSV